MEILKTVANVLHYPAWFGVVFGIFISVFLLFEHYKELKQTDGKYGLFHIILIICMAIAVIYFPLQYYIDVNTETVYDKLKTYSSEFYQIDDKDNALEWLARDLKQQCEARETDEEYSTDYELGYDDGYRDGYFDAENGTPPMIE